MLTKVSVELSLVPGHGDVLRVEGVTVTTGSVAQGVQARVPVSRVQLARQVVQRISHTEQSTSSMALYFRGKRKRISRENVKAISQKCPPIGKIFTKMP